MSAAGTMILGGGLAGLAASMYTGAPVYEADARAGGVASSDMVDGFTFDRGIHILQTKNAKVLALLAELGVSMRSHSRRAYIYSHGRYTAYPFQVNTAGLPLLLRARCVAGFMGRARHPEPCNYEEWMYRALGNGFARTFLIPYSEKFWTVHPREMTFEWTNRIPQPSIWQVLRGAVWDRTTKIGTNVDFRYPELGCGYGSIASALERRAGEVKVGHRATSIDVKARSVRFNDSFNVPYERLITTIPLPDLIRICPAAPPEIRAAAARLRTNSVMVVNLGVSGDGVSDRHWVHFPEKTFSFFRISFPHNFGPGLAPPGTSSISAEVAYSNAAPINKDTIVARVIEDLRQVGILKPHNRILVTATRDIKYAYCIYDMSRREARDAVRSWLNTQGIVTCGRYGLWTYFWSDESILSGKKAAEEAAGGQVPDLPLHDA